MKPLLLFAVLACVSQSSSPQTPSHKQEDTLKSSYLNEKIEKVEDTPLVYNNFKKTIQLSIKNKDYKSLGEAYVGLAKWHEDKTALHSSIIYSQKGIDVFQKHNLLKPLTNTYLLFSTIINGVGNYEKSKI